MRKRWLAPLALSLVTALIGLGITKAPLARAANPISSICTSADQKNLPTSCKDINNSGNPLFGKDGILTKAINILSLIGGVVSVFVIFIGGVKFITSSGDPSSVNSARNTLLYAIIALLIMATAQVAVRFILGSIK